MKENNTYFSEDDIKRILRSLEVETPSLSPPLHLNIVSKDITAKTIKLKTTWTKEMLDDINTCFKKI